MARQVFTLELWGTPRLIEIVYNTRLQGIQVFYDKLLLGSIPDARALAAKPSFSLSDGTKLVIERVPSWGSVLFRVLHEGLPVPNLSQSPPWPVDPAKLSYVMGGITLLAGVLAQIEVASFAERIEPGFAWGAGGVFLLLGFLIARGARWALWLALILNTLDVLSVVWAAFFLESHPLMRGLYFHLLCSSWMLRALYPKTRGKRWWPWLLALSAILYWLAPKPLERPPLLPPLPDPNEEAYRHDKLAPEVKQATPEDSDVASLQALLSGYDINTDYEDLTRRLKEDCDLGELREVALPLGLKTVDTLVAPENLLLPNSLFLPALVLAETKEERCHMIVLWGVEDGKVQVMDPALGQRQFLPIEEAKARLGLYFAPLPAKRFRNLMGLPLLMSSTLGRLTALGFSSSDAQTLIESCLTDQSWVGAAALDAALRLTEERSRQGAFHSQEELRSTLRDNLTQAQRTATQQEPSPATEYWSVRPLPPDDSGEPQLELRASAILFAVGRNIVREP